MLVHTAKPRTPQRLQLWLELLLACAAEQRPRSAVLIGRDQNRFRILERFEAPGSVEAREQLEQLLIWRGEHRERCWPLPPETGWSYAAAEARGRGWIEARSTWEGTPQSPAEREDPVQRVCFGSDLPLSELLSPRLQALALELHEPLLQARQVLKP